MRYLLIRLFVLCLLAAPALAQDLKTIPEKIELSDGETLVFLGDSITHQCLYTQYIEDYFYTRYPTTTIRFHNAGVGGDRAADALVRFNEDVAAFTPKYITILLGMNDGSYRHFEREVFDTYERDMTTLLDRIDAIGARAVLMTPTMFDSRAVILNDRKQPDEVRDKYYNGVLAFYGAWLREQALGRGLGFVDMYGPLNQLTLEQRKTDANFTLIKDAVHPDAPGQVVMAVAILNDMHVNRRVTSITATRVRGAWRVNGVNGEVSDIKELPDGGLSFTFAANALPWVLPTEAREGYKLTKAGHKFSNEALKVADLAPGRYELRIDGLPVGTYTHIQLGTKIELQENDKTPQYRQALGVAALNKEKNDEAMRPIRNLWRTMKLKRRQQESQRDPAAWAAWMDEFNAKLQPLQQSVVDYERRIYQINKPAPRQYEIAPVKAGK